MMTKRTYRFCLLLLASIVGYSASQAQEIETESEVETYPYLPACVEKMYMASDSVKKDHGAIEEIEWLREHREDCTNNSAVTRRLSLRLMELGDNEYGTDGSTKKVNKKELYRESLEWARVAVQEDITDDINYENMSMAFAALLSVSRLRTQARLADSVRVYAEKAVEINPENHRAYHILGRWHYEVSKLSPILRRLSKIVFRTSPEGSFKLAVDYFNEAIVLNNIPVHHYWLGLAYLESGRKSEALSQFRYLLELEDDGKYNATFFKDKARKLIDKHG